MIRQIRCMTMNKVYNLKLDKNIPKDVVFIGRPSAYGNPFIIGKDGTREEVIEKYRRWVNQRPYMIAKIKMGLKGKDLLCFCSPLPCHGDVLIRIANG